jgi:hypothetical protein
MQKFTLFFFLIALTFTSKAQNIKLEGIVTDNSKIGLEMANVMVVNEETKAMDGYSITNDKGKFQLSLKPNTVYTIKVSYIGYATFEEKITTGAENSTKNIVLVEGMELDGVEIVREMPVSIKGDTIVYNADSFTSGTERKLEDILRKLPGVEVNADGEVEVEGKKVQKLMVDGKDFFDGDTKLGVKNIPADAIDKIEVLRNYNENSILKGVENNQDNLAMNIKLKSGKKNFWFGDVNAGGGMDDTNKFDRFLANPKLFYYNPKYSINIISNFNNIGELPLTIQDYFKFTGGFRSMMAKGGSSFNVSSNNLGIPLLRNNRAKEIDTKFGATNFSYNVAKAWTLSGFGIFSSSTTDTETITSTNFLRPNSNEVASTQNSNQLANQRSTLGLVKLSSQYKPNEKFQMDYDVLSKFSKQDGESSLFRQVIDENLAERSENIFTESNQQPITINQNLSFYYTPTNKHIFAFETQHMYQEEDPFYNADLQTQPFDLDGFVTGQDRNDINQERFVKTSKLDSKLDYYYILTPKSNINVTVGNTYSYQNFNSRMFQILDNETINDLDDAVNTNDVTYRFNDVFLGLHYKLLTGKFTFTPGLSVHHYLLDNEQLGTNFKMNFSRVLPDFLAIYQIKKSETLTYNFSLNNNFSDINNLAEGFVLNNFNSLSRGNRTLENSIQQTHTLSYFKYNMFNFENISANVNYNKSVEAIKNRATFDNVNQVSSPFNSPFADESVTGSLRYGRGFLRYYKASLNVNLNWSKFNNIQVDRNTGKEIFITNEQFRQTYNVKASTNFKNLPNLELGYGYVVNQLPNETFFTDSPTVKLDYFFLKSFSFVSEYEYFHYYNKDKTIENEYDFLSASFIYQKTKASHWEYKLSATNILNTKILRDNSFSQFATSDSQYTVQPRYVLVSLKYNL